MAVFWPMSLEGDIHRIPRFLFQVCFIPRFLFQVCIIPRFLFQVCCSKSALSPAFCSKSALSPAFCSKSALSLIYLLAASKGSTVGMCARFILPALNKARFELTLFSQHSFPLILLLAFVFGSDYFKYRLLRVSFRLKWFINLTIHPSLTFFPSPHLKRQ